MVTGQYIRQTAPQGAVPGIAFGPTAFPNDLTSWMSSKELLAVVRDAAVRASGSPWMELLGGSPFPLAQDDLLVLVAYCYLQGVYPSLDVVRQLDSDENLTLMRPRFGLRPEEVRQFRRERRSALADCLTCALAQLWRLRHPYGAAEVFSDSLVRNRHNFGFLEPFYLQARERLDRSIVLDSMALDD